MKRHTSTSQAWAERARQNLRAAILLAARRPALVHPAVSRIYYACFQGAVAALHTAGVALGEDHGEVWRAAESLRPGLGNAIWSLYKWRRRADYATGVLLLEEGLALVARHATICRSIGITEAD